MTHPHISESYPLSPPIEAPAVNSVPEVAFGYEGDELFDAPSDEQPAATHLVGISDERGVEPPDGNGEGKGGVEPAPELSEAELPNDTPITEGRSDLAKLPEYPEHEEPNEDFTQARILADFTQWQRDEPVESRAAVVGELPDLTNAEQDTLKGINVPYKRVRLGDLSELSTLRKSAKEPALPKRSCSLYAASMKHLLTQLLTTPKVTA